MHHWEKAVLFTYFTAVPPLLVEIWWKQRRRRADEQILGPGGVGSGE
jgi:hypothetical protein